jgi:hypothetical protein
VSGVVIADAAAFWPGGRGVAALAAAVAAQGGRQSATGGPDAAPARFADADLGAALTMRGLRPLSRTARLAMVAAVDIWPSAGASTTRDAIVLGSRWAGVEPLADFVRQAAMHGPDMVFPMAFPNTVASVHAGYVAILLGIPGANITVCGRESGREAFARGVSLIEADRADRVLVLAADAAEAAVVAGDPTAAEAAGALLLVSDTTFLAEHRRPLARVESWRLDRPDSLGLDASRAAADDGPDAALDQVVGECGAAAGLLALALAAHEVGRTNTSRRPSGPCGVRGHLSVTLAPFE